MRRLSAIQISPVQFGPDQSTNVAEEDLKKYFLVQPPWALRDYDDTISWPQFFERVKHLELLNAVFTWKGYRRFLIFTALLHLLSAGATAYVITGRNKDWPVRLCASYSVWTPTYAGYACFRNVYNTSGVISETNPGNGTSITNVCNRNTGWKHAGTIDPGWMVVSFFILSFLFQLPCALHGGEYNPFSRLVTFEKYREWLAMGVQPLRFVEYSASSTVMILIVALLNGQTDLWLLLAVAGCNWSTMIFGLINEQMMKLRAEPISKNFIGNAGAHLAGWVPFIIVWTILTSQFEWSLFAIDKVPKAVKVRQSGNTAHVFIFKYGIRYSKPQHIPLCRPSRWCSSSSLRYSG